MISRELHDKGGGIAGKHFGLFEHNARDDDGCNPQEIRAGRYPPRAAEQSSGNQGNDGKLSAAGDKGSGHNGHAAVAFVFNRSTGHDTRDTTAGANEHRNKGFSRQTKFTEDTVHHKRNTRHIAARLQKREEEEQHQHLRNKSQYRADAADDAV